MRARLPIALAAGVASACGFAPFGIWPLTLACVAVLMAIVAQATSGRGAFLIGWAFGVGQFTLGLNWIAHAFDFQNAMPHWLGYVAVVLLSLYLAVYPGAAAWMAWRIAGGGSKATGRGRFTLAFAAAWIATEYCRATVFTGFAWNPLGMIALGLPMASYARWVGTYGLSGIAVLTAGILWWLAAWARDAATGTRGRDAAHLAAAAAMSGLIVAVGFGLPVSMFGEGTPAVRDVGPLVRVVQPNLSLAEQRDAASEERNMATLTRLSGAPGATPRLLLWPEGAVPYYLAEDDWARVRVARLLGPRDVLLTGGSTLIYDRSDRLTAARNTVFAIDARSAIVASYDKTHLVPYGEYLPVRPLLSAIGLARLVESDVDFEPGGGSLVADVPGFGRIGVQICYEIIFSGQVTHPGERPAFIFNPSIDAWFGAWGPPQHLAQARMRALEEGLPVVRATTTGISAVIDASGRIVTALPLDKAGVITARMPPALPPTPFARWGNSLPLALALLLAILAVARRPTRR